MEVVDVVSRTSRGLGASGVREVSVLSSRPDANIVVALTLLPSGRRVVAKARTGASGCDGVRAAKALGALCAALPPDAALAVPRVLLHDAAVGLLVTDHAPGVPLDRALAVGDLAALRRAGAALAALHALSAVVGPPVRLRDCLVELVRPHPAVLATAWPEVGPSVRSLLAGVLSAEPPVGAIAPLHRDVHLRQLLGDGSRTWLLDWDVAAQGDPAFDIGNLLASLRSKAVGEDMVEALLEGYASGDSTGALARTPVYEAFTYLRLACKRYRQGGRTDIDLVESLLSAAERTLTACPSAAPEGVHA